MTEQEITSLFSIKPLSSPPPDGILNKLDKKTFRYPHSIYDKVYFYKIYIIRYMRRHIPLLFLVPIVNSVSAHQGFKALIRYSLTNEFLPGATAIIKGIINGAWKNYTLFGNVENYTNVRQTKIESLCSAPYETPQFTEV